MYSCRSPPKVIQSFMAQVVSLSIATRGSVILSRGVELGDEEKLMEDSRAGDRLKDYNLSWLKN